MKPILRRIFPLILGGAVVVFAACQDTSQNPTDPGVGVLEGRGGPTLQSQINQVMKKVWPNGHADKKQAKKAKANMFGAGPGSAGAQAAATELIELAVVSGADPDDIQDLVDLVSQFSGLTQGTFVDASSPMPIVVTDVPGNTPGMGGVKFEPGDLQQDVVVIVELKPLPCHPLNQLPIQADDCLTIRTIPDLGAYQFPNDGVLFGVCTDAFAQNFSLLGLFRSEGPGDTDPVVKIVELPTPNFIVGAGSAATECQPSPSLQLGSASSNWLGNFAQAGWEKVGKPLASLFTPQPAYATALVARAGSLGGRTKNFSNFGWAETGGDLDYGAEGYRYLELDRAVGDTLPTDFETPGFDDSTWDVGTGPFWEKPGSASCVLPDGGTTWTAAAAGVVGPTEATEILLRRPFYLPADATNVQVGILIDNDVQVWVNGVEVSGGIQTHEGCFNFNPLSSFPVGIGAVTVPGVNSLVVRGIDRGVMSYVDAQVTYDIGGGEE